MKHKFRNVPKHRIPKITAQCIVCGELNVSTVMSQAFAAGYHRRHLCNECDTPFYTLAHYGKSTYEVQARPFKDRALTPWEEQQRMEWEAEGSNVTMQVITPFATEFVETINFAFEKLQKGEVLAGEEHRLIAAINQLEKEFT